MSRAIVWVAAVPSAVIGVLGGGVWWILPAMVMGLIIVMVLFRVLKSLATEFPAHSQTVGEAARTVVGLNYGRLAEECGPGRDVELEEALRYVLSDLSGIEPSTLIQENPSLSDIVLANDGLRAQV